jgi:hypothetical protein
MATSTKRLTAALYYHEKNNEYWHSQGLSLWDLTFAVAPKAPLEELSTEVRNDLAQDIRSTICDEESGPLSCAKLLPANLSFVLRKSLVYISYIVIADMICELNAPLMAKGYKPLSVAKRSQLIIEKDSSGY